MGKRLNLDITEEEYAELKVLAKESNVSVSDIISTYVHDLVCSNRSGGSDERLFASDYFNRSWVSWLNKAD